MNFKDILIIKVGTSTLTKVNAVGERVIDNDSFKQIGEQVKELRQKGHGIIIVSSAAISGGMAHVGMTKRPDKNTAMPELQRLASIGWRHVLNCWADALTGLVVGELLVTKSELGARKREAGELMRVMHVLLSHGDIAVANENDAITHSEITFGDNDTLAAHIAVKIKRSSLFDCDVRLFLLSDVDGVYADVNDSGSVISTIENIDAYMHLAGRTQSSTGTGGMETKFAAAVIALESGIEVWIGNGRCDKVISHMLDRTSGTYFMPQVLS